MRWYAETPALRNRQILSDLGVLLWSLLWLRIGTAVHGAVMKLAAPGRQLEDAGNSLSGGLSDAAGKAGGVPLVGDGLRSPLDAAAGAGKALAGAGIAQQDAVSALALLLGVVIVLLPVLYVVGRWLPGRMRWGREASAAASLRGDVELLALRAATRLPMSSLARLGPEPVGRWRRGEPGAAEALAALELRELGLVSSPAGPATGRPPVAAR